MSESDINTIVADLDRWALGELGSKLTWAMLEERFGFSRQSLQAKSEIKAAYDNAKRSLSGGLVKSKDQATKEAKELQIEVERLKAELEAYKCKEKQWLRRWQQIAFHVRQKACKWTALIKFCQKVWSYLLIEIHLKFCGHLIRKSHLPGEGKP